jgi:hypothetical protein
MECLANIDLDRNCPSKFKTKKVIRRHCRIFYTNLKSMNALCGCYRGNTKHKHACRNPSCAYFFTDFVDIFLDPMWRHRVADCSYAYTKTSWWPTSRA